MYQAEYGDIWEAACIIPYSAPMWKFTDKTELVYMSILKGGLIYETSPLSQILLTRKLSKMFDFITLFFVHLTVN